MRFLVGEDSVMMYQKDQTNSCSVSKVKKNLSEMTVYLF